MQFALEGTLLMIRKFIAIALFVAFLCTALLIPIFFQSMTLWYKFGIDRVYLMSAQFIGLVAFVLLYVQVVLSTRGKLLEGVFGLGTLMKLHKINGLLILFLALLHVILVLVPEGIANLPLGWEFWPELLGLGLLFILLVIVISSRYRERLKLEYKKWRAFHKPLGYLAILLVSGHVLFVSDSFEHIAPRLFLIFSCAGLILWISYVKFSANRQQKRSKQ